MLWQSIYTRPVAVAALVVFATFAMLRVDESWRGHSDWRAVADYVRQRAKPGEPVYVTNGWVQRNFRYYWNAYTEQYWADGQEMTGPVWIVTGGCMPRREANAAPLMRQWPQTEWAEVRYLRPGQRMKRLEICPD